MLQKRMWLTKIVFIPLDTDGAQMSTCNMAQRGESAYPFSELASDCTLLVSCGSRGKLRTDTIRI